MTDIQNKAMDIILPLVVKGKLSGNEMKILVEAIMTPNYTSTYTYPVYEPMKVTYDSNTSSFTNID